MSHSDNGESEDQIVARVTKLFASQENDAVQRIRKVYQPIGREIAIANERGYFDEMGLGAWMWLKFKKSETHGRECWQCWKDRHTFERALLWWRTGNTGFTPKKMSGPPFSRELCRAYDNRLKSDADKVNQKGRKKGPTAKELCELVAKWHSRYTRVKDGYLEWAEQHQREPRLINQIEAEIAADEAAEGAAASGVDVGADPQRTSDAAPDEANDLDDALNDNVKMPEQQGPGQHDSDQPEVDAARAQAEREPGHYPDRDMDVEAGTAEAQHTSDAAWFDVRKPEPDEAPEPPQSKSDDMTPWEVKFGAAPRPDGVAAIAIIEQRWHLKGFRGGSKISPERRLLARINRARVFLLLNEKPDAAIADFLAKLTVKTWLRDDFEELSIQALVDIG